MKKKISVLLVCTLCSVLFAGCSAAGVFRGVSFGMSREEVQSAENAGTAPDTVLEGSGLRYRGVPFGNLTGDLFYRFGNGDTLTDVIFYAYGEHATDDGVAAMKEAAKMEWGLEFSENTSSGFSAQGDGFFALLEYEPGGYLVLTLTAQ